MIRVKKSEYYEETQGKEMQKNIFQVDVDFSL